MNKVKRAIIVAAGKGTRLHPITITTPKPLIKVNGVRMIDTIIKGLLKNNIEEIYIVVGYLKEQFEELKKDYSNITIIEDPNYDTGNNITSLYAAKDYLEDVMILDADQIIYNEKILNPYFERSGYCCSWTEKNTTEWLLQTNKDGIVTSCSRTGGQNGWKLYGVSKWNKEDGQKLKKYLDEELKKNNNQIYWDDIALFSYPKEFALGIYEIKEEDIIEIDNLDELILIDKSYQKEVKK